MTRTAFDLPAEQAVIGAALLQPAVLDDLTLSADDFHHPPHPLIWTTLRKMRAAGQTLDAITVAGRLNDDGHLARVGGASYLHDLMRAVPTVANASHYAATVAEHAARRRLASLAERLADMAESGSDLADILTTARALLDGVEHPASTRGLRLTPVSDIEMQPVTWLWDERIATGALTLVPGREGIGKSLFLAWLTARITRGDLPGVYFGKPRSVIYAATEDSWSHTIAPRLHVAGADLTRVFQVRMDYEGRSDQLTLPRDTGAVFDLIERHGVVLLAADPLLSLLDAATDTHRDRAVRAALEPMIKRAAETGCAVVGLAHFNKSASSDSLNLVTGTRAFTALARGVIAVARDGQGKDDPCVMTLVKSNLGRLDLPSLAYVLETAEVSDDRTGVTVATGRLRFTGESSRSVHDILNDTASGDGDDRTERDEAADWLNAYLTQQGGSATRTDVLKAARAAGFAESTLKRCRDRAGVEAVRGGFQGGSIWRLTIDHTQLPPSPFRSHSDHSAQHLGAELNEPNVSRMEPSEINSHSTSLNGAVVR